MRVAAVLLAALTATACAPSRATIFDPVRAAVLQRTGVAPRWREDWRRPAAVDKQVAELLGAPLTADGAAAIAILHSEELQAVYAELAAAGAEVASARALPNPEVEAEIFFPLDHDDDPELEFSAMLDLTALLAIAPRAGAAGAELAAARREAVARTVDLAARARARLYQAAAAERRLELRRTTAETASAAAALARDLHAAGNLTDLELAREAVFEEETLTELGEAEAEAAAARESLATLLGLGPHQRSSWTFAGEILDGPPPPEDTRELEREAVASSLELQALRLRLEAAGGRVGVARMESFLPHLSAGAVFARESDEWHAGPAVSLSLPIFDWGQGKRAAAWAQVRRLQHRYAAAALEVRAAARAVDRRVRLADDRLARVRDRVVPLRTQLLGEGVKQYNAMNLGPFELLQLRREQIDAEERHIDALLDAWIARTAAWQLRAGSRPTSPNDEGQD